MIFRQLRGEDRWPVVHLLRAWGYPRELVEHELSESLWFRYGEDVLAWLHHDGELGYGHVLLHVCSAPASRGRIYARPFLHGMEVLAMVADGDVLVARRPLPEVVSDYLERLGWTANAAGWYKPLGGDRGPSAASAAPERAEGGEGAS